MTITIFSIILTNGKVINIKADEVEWYEKPRIIRFAYKGEIVAGINMDNVAGWINTGYKVETRGR